MNILHATTDPDLLTRLREMLGGSARADIAVGYFFISGFEAVADHVAHLDRVRVLVGRTDGRVLEEVALGIQQADALRSRLDADSIVQRSQRSELAQRSVAGIADGVSQLPQSSDSESAVQRLRDLIADKRVEVRAYLRSTLHAKAYLCWYDNHPEPGSAIVGSSNFTLAGFEGNTELNVRVTGDAEMKELGRWFNDLWEDAEDISDALLAELNRSWALARTPPYHVYLKALYELYNDEVRGGELPLRTTDLANFQVDAVSRALAMIEAHGGCYIGDVVGLGKTYVGAELLRQLRQTYPQDGPPLILCPAGLRPMWERVNEQFGLGAAVVSHSMIAAPPQLEYDEELGRYVDAEPAGHGIVLQEHYPTRGAVLVDEAHNFRNINRRSAGLSSYLEEGDHKVVLLSATPQNLGPRDIYRQLRLFLDETEHGLNIEPLGLEAYFRCAEVWHNHRADFENYTEEFREWEESNRKGTPPIRPDPPNVPRADIEQVLTPVFIRRRRKDITELYGDSAEINGKPVRFPEPRLSNIQYRLDKVYEKAGAFSELQRLLDEHKATRYRVTDYIKPEAKGKAEYADLFRARNRIARLMRALLFKRLESSIAAFRSTLGVLMRSNRNFRDSLSSGFVPIGSTATRLLSGEAFDADDALEVLRQEEERRKTRVGARSTLVHSADDFDVVRWLSAIDADYEALSDIQRRVAGIGPADDDKLRALREFLGRPEVKAGKVLVFSEAETTIEYLHDQLNPGGVDSTIARLTGSNSDSAERIIKRFAPGQNLLPTERMPGTEIRLLFATDIVSEGQNLQDCARILNYDLHWNPVRLIQRFGRIDRIGTEHEVIDLHNMWPDTAVDEGLNLTERLHNRIQSFHDVIGLDSKLLSEAERLNGKEMYSIYVDGKLPETEDGLDDVAANQRAIALLQRIQDDDPCLWDTITNLPDGIRSALQAKSGATGSAYSIDGAQFSLEIDGSQMPLMTPSGAGNRPSPFDEPRAGETLTLLRQGDFKGCYAVSDDGEGKPSPRPISPAQLIAAVECGPDTPAQPLPEGTNERVMAAFDAFRADVSRRLGRAGRRTDSRNRRYVSRQLNIVRNLSESTEHGVIDTLRQIFLGDLSPQIESALSDVRNMRLEGQALVRRLEALRERFRLNPASGDSRPRSNETQVVRIICSDGLV